MDMAASITSRRPTDPTLEEIEAGKAEIQARRAERLEEDRRKDRERRKESKRHQRQRQLQRHRVKALQAAANRMLQQDDEQEPIDVDYRDPRQVEEWLPVPAVEDNEPAASRLKPAAERHRGEFYTRFFPSWERLTPKHEKEARDQSRQWAEEQAWKRKHILGYAENNPHVPTWTVEESMASRTARENIDEELAVMGYFRSVDRAVEFMPCFLALQRRILARYLWGMKREGRKVPRNRPTNWGFKLANQLMQEIEEGEPLDLDDCCPAAVKRVAADARRIRVKRDLIPFRAKQH